MSPHRVTSRKLPTKYHAITVQPMLRYCMKVWKIILCRLSIRLMGREDRVCDRLRFRKSCPVQRERYPLLVEISHDGFGGKITDEFIFGHWTSTKSAQGTIKAFTTR